ncbi:helix-turn-helix domain-containing protein [Robertmurraya sp. FSL R5-0851]|uniref:helix-turn-helix domain-containing protein n=1 Tax=Robertmurraya sp. FSL R5-0851 TaxID=2921584 RepID=UPI0030F64A4A
MRIGDIIREARKQKNLTLRELELLSGVSHSQISKIERFVDNPTKETVYKLVEALEIENELIDTSEHKKIDTKDLIRYQVLTRDNFTCQLCGNIAPETKVVVAKIVPSELEDEQDQNNLITLCSHCNNGRTMQIEQEGIDNDILYKNHESKNQTP